MSGHFSLVPVLQFPPPPRLPANPRPGGRGGSGFGGGGNGPGGGGETIIIGYALELPGDPG